MAEGSTTKTGKRGNRAGRSKKVEGDKQEREVGNNAQKVTFAKEIGEEYIDYVDFEAMVEEVRKDVLREIREWKEVGDKRIKGLEERIEELEKGLDKLLEVREMDMGVGRMEEGNEGIECKRENKLGNNNVREEQNRIGGGSSYRKSVISMEGISITSEVFSDEK